ncbi:MAG: damage-inducible protein DinB [Rhodobacteraceae bacterium]|nr:damage-inducible protein DinB [Paracoccaceae bacterium]
MIDPDYCRRMVRYNSWQNRQLGACLAELPAAELTRDRGAFFGSILATLNHILWGDRMWMSRFAGWDKPAVGIPESTSFCPTLAVWQAERYRTDGQLGLWAARVRAVDLAGDLVWYSGALGADVRKPMAVCVTHMFNHQTHHRGQVHAMITAAGAKAPVSDLAFMPD